MSKMRAILEESFGQEVLPSFDHYVELLMEASASFNLTGLRETESILEELVYDAARLKSLAEEKGYPLIGQGVDIGSGSGSPGIPLACLLPETHFVLVEAINKKARFLTETIKAMEFDHVGVMAERSETMAGDPFFRGLFNFATCKAVGSLSEVIELTMPLLKLNGLLFAYKGESVNEEIEQARRALKELHAEVTDVLPYTLPLRKSERAVVVVRKMGVSPYHFPRRPGLAHKRPL